jgi:hypothetical protein
MDEKKFTYQQRKHWRSHSPRLPPAERETPPGLFGCFRMTNEDVVDLYNRVSVGTTVVVKNWTLINGHRQPSATISRALRIAALIRTGRALGG